MSAELERFIFEAEWYDKVACTLKKFYLHFFPSDNSVELFDLKTKKTFLRRSKCEGIEAKDFYVGAIVTIFSRSMKILNFADPTTRDKLSSNLVKTFLILKSNAIDKLSHVLKYIIDQDFQVSNIKMIKLDQEDAKQIFKSSDEKLPDIIENMTSGPIIGLELFCKDGKSKSQELRSVFEKSDVSDCIYIPDNTDEVQKIFFFLDKSRKKKLKSSATMKNCTCCIIKPHAVQSGLIAPIVNDIQKAGFIISAIQQFHIELVNAEEFLEVYKGVLPDYSAMVSELQAGPCIAMEITHKDPNYDIVTEFRKFCGPMDTEMAKQLRPNTLRAKYGKSKIQNAIHCSDLQEDGLLEVEYFFKILDDN